MFTDVRTLNVDFTVDHMAPQLSDYAWPNVCVSPGLHLVPSEKIVYRQFMRM